MAVAYGSLLGGSATYFTTANIIASDLLTTASPPQAALHILDFTPTGGLMALVGIAFVAWLGPRLLQIERRNPNRSWRAARGANWKRSITLASGCGKCGFQQEKRRSAKRLAELDLGERLGIAVVAIWRGRQALFAPSSNQLLHSDDILLTVGREERVSQLTSEGLKSDARTPMDISVHAVCVL